MLITLRMVFFSGIQITVIKTYWANIINMYLIEMNGKKTTKKLLLKFFDKPKKEKTQNQNLRKYSTNNSANIFDKPFFVMIDFMSHILVIVHFSVLDYSNGK